MSNCHCCGNRTAVKETSYHKYREEFTYEFCQQCRNGHDFCPNYPALDEPKDRNLRNYPDYDSDRGKYTCWCCELRYHSHEGVKMRYESGWEKWMCTNCALRQQVSWSDKSLVTQDSMRKLHDKI